MVDIHVPEDLRHLRDFPTYDTTFQDSPKFRQSLQYWSFKTEKFAATLTSLADSFEHFHKSGLEHYEAAIHLVQGLQEISAQCENNKGNTIAGPLQQFSESLNNIWCYYESFLGQTQLLNADPIRELANTFNNLKKLNEELLHYRTEYISAAEALCAYRNVSKLVDKATFVSLAEDCYTAQKTYRLVLSKYVMSLRQAHTQDMISLVRRVIEHILSLYSYCNYSAQVLKDLEPSVNELFTKTKEWQAFYQDELQVWGRVHHSVQRHILAEFQLYVGLLPSQQLVDTTTWYDVANAAAMVPISAGKKILKILPTTGNSQKDLKSQALLSPDWCMVGTEEGQAPDFAPRRQTVTAISFEEKTKKPLKLPAVRTYSTPVVDPDSQELHKKKKLRDKRKLVKSISDPDIISSSTTELLRNANGAISGRTAPLYSGPRDDRVVELRDKLPEPSSPIVRYSRDTTESAANAIEELLRQSSPTPRSGSLSSSFSAPFRPLAAVLGRSRWKHKDKDRRRLKKGEKVSTSLDDLCDPSGNIVTPEEPAKEAKQGGNGIFQRARNSLRHLVSQEKGVPAPTPSQEHSTSEGKGSHVDHSPLASTRPSDGLRHSISSPVPRKESVSPESAHLHSLVLPVPESWVQCGYLWLRMKLPNNRYAWTYIYCVVDRSLGQLMIQEQSLPEPRRLENLMLCTTKVCTPDFIDRNYCFRVISPTSEHLFQTLSEQELQFWVDALQKTTVEALKKFETCPQELPDQQEGGEGGEGGDADVVPDAMALILAVPGNNRCADCSSTDVEWTSINLGIVLCITCSGVHRSLGVHVSKVRSLNLDKWDRTTVEFMQSQGNTKSNSYYEAMLGKGVHSETKRPLANTKKEERAQFIRQKYVSLAFVPEIDDRSTHL